jgi:hypothetical protein
MTSSISVSAAIPAGAHEVPLGDFDMKDGPCQALGVVERAGTDVSPSAVKPVEPRAIATMLE